MREWLTVIVALLILAVVLDGIRRMRQARRGNIRMSSSVRRRSREGDDGYGSELPNGGARVVNVRKPDDAQQRYQQIRKSRNASKPRPGESSRIPQQVALNLDEHVPTLMEVEPEAKGERKQAPASQDTRQREEPDNSRDDLLDDGLDFSDGGRIEPQLSDAFDSVDGDTAEPRAEPIARKKPAPSAEADFDSDLARQQDAGQLDDDFPAHDLYDEADSDPEDDEVLRVVDDEEDEAEFREPEDVLVINIMAPKGHHFCGDALLETVLERGMRFGSMNIFHHHAQANGKGGVYYSMANIVVPGTFDLATMKEFTTPGVSLFLALPSETDSSGAFEAMLTTAKAIAENLGGDMKDENRSVMTAQTIEHYRSRIKEFERKLLSRTPA